MNRRKFITYSALAGSSFIVNLGLHQPKPAYGFFFLIFIPAAAPSLLGLALGGLALAALGSRGFSKRTQAWYDKRLDAQLAQREFLHRQFTDVSVAEVNHSQYNYIIGAEIRENLGLNAALAFPRIEYDQPSVSTFSGAASIGMSIAAQYLKKHEKMSYQEIESAILPRVSGASVISDWRNWDNSSFPGAYPNAYSDFRGVSIRYDAVEPRHGGFGTIDVTVNAHRMIKIPQIKVNFA
jgi:hypothetical protein